MSIQDQIAEMQQRALDELAAAGDLVALDEWRLKYLGKKGELTGFLRGMGQLPAEERPVVGQVVNTARRALEDAAAIRQTELSAVALDARLAADKIDVTLPGRPVAPGRLHIITRTMREIIEAFSAMGFQVVEGPEVELDHYNFELLNMPPGHPARSMHDTFYFSDSVLLRTHTSPNQIRFMEQYKPPIRIIVPGKCYRSEATDASHDFMFYQVEGLAVDKDVTLADLRGTLADFARRLFGQERKVRFRCDYFPYVEPGVDLSIDCAVCNGVGCRVCKYTGWLEILGAGMVHPQVLRNVGIDPEVYSGWAFGMGPSRISMLKYGIDDIRQFFRNDLRFLNQFS
jgi:phenylalanyl-tRNA synthetase alpha chain